jgi:hypothetical protein
MAYDTLQISHTIYSNTLNILILKLSPSMMTEHDHDNNKNEDYSPVISDISNSISDIDPFEVLNALESIGFRFPKIINTKSSFISSV